MKIPLPTLNIDPRGIGYGFLKYVTLPSLAGAAVMLGAAGVLGSFGVLRTKIPWLGLRNDMLAGIPDGYLYLGAIPAVGTVIFSITIAIRWLKDSARPVSLSLRHAVTAVLLSHVFFAFAAFYLGRATASRSNPRDMVLSAAQDVKNQADRDRYRIQSDVATLLGDTRIVDRKPFITIQQIEQMEKELKPGDILLERRNWYLSNPFLPGFWPHAALYVGRPEDLKELGISDHPAVRKHAAEYGKPCSDGHLRTVIEALSEGVVLSSLTHSLHADYAAVLRPQLKKAQTAKAIIRAFEHLGKAYDFNFDFDDRSRLVCSQVIYVVYEGMIDFKTVRVMGRNTLPCNDIARMFAVQRARPDRLLDFVLFLDGNPDTGQAVRCSEDAFCKSIKRPRALVER